jgi:hypothetical protein
MRLKSTLAAIVLLLPLILQGGRKTILMHSSARASKREILRVVPIGTSIASVKEIMERNGFTCGMKQNANFTEEDLREGELVQTEHRALDYLYCEKEQMVQMLVVRRWQVALVNRGGVVQDVYVSTGLIAP